MVELTDTAHAELKNYFNDKDIVPVRVFIATGGCAGAQLSLALDEVRKDDETFDFADGISVVIDKELLAEAKTVKIDKTDTGFTLDSPINLAGVGGHEGGCGGCSGCG